MRSTADESNMNFQDSNQKLYRNITVEDVGYHPTATSHPVSKP